MKRKTSIQLLVIITLLWGIGLLYVGCNPKTTVQEDAYDSSGIEENTIESSNKVLLVTGEYPPYTSESMENKGFFTEMIGAILDESGIEYEIEFYPWDRCRQMVLNGEAWASFPYGHSEINDTNYFFTDAVFQTKHQFYYLKGNPKITRETMTYSKLGDFKDQIFGGASGYWYGKPEDIQALGINAEWASDIEALIKMLLAERIDFFVEDEWVMNDLVERVFPEDEENILSLPNSAREQSYYLIVSKDYSGCEVLIEQFNDALKTLQENGELDAILKENNIVD